MDKSIDYLTNLYKSIPKFKVGIFGLALLTGCATVKYSNYNFEDSELLDRLKRNYEIISREPFNHYDGSFNKFLKEVDCADGCDSYISSLGLTRFNSKRAFKELNKSH